MSRFAAAAAVTIMLAVSCPLSPARADVVIKVDKARQSMSVLVDGEQRYTWPVSTGLVNTPSGSYRPQSFSRYHRSSLFNNAPMPYAIFYDGHYAIHGTNQISRLGRRASKGCVRLHPNHAAVLFALVRKQGSANTTIVVQ